MRISTKGRYALRVMLDLAAHRETAFVPLRDISERQGISLKYLERIISSLNRAGFLKSSRGASGGYALMREARDYTAGEILRAAEGNLSPTMCTEDENACEKHGNCTLYLFWAGLDRAIAEYVDSVTLEDIMKNSIR